MECTIRQHAEANSTVEHTYFWHTQPSQMLSMDIYPCKTQSEDLSTI